ncbi:hypothetical protein PYCC9005_003113 [Savitreella phatthalungensis]
MSSAFDPSKTTYSFMRGLVEADVNPLNNKSRTLPLLNPINKYGRTFHMAWFAFFCAFLSWFAFPPLLHGALKKDLVLTTAQVGNSNIIGLLATLFVRLLVGPLCDRYGARYVMVGVLVAGAIPTACVPAIGHHMSGVQGLYAIRFFIGILGGTFVPCVVWTTQFFDRSIVGRANGLAAGWGNAGAGVAFFSMVNVQEALFVGGKNLGESWRLAFVVLPLPILVITAITILLFGHDTPTGPWATRHLHAQGRAVDTNALDRAFSNDGKSYGMTEQESLGSASGNITPPHSTQPQADKKPAPADIERGQVDEQIGTIETLPDEPTFVDTLKVLIHPQALYLGLSYMCSFGCELAIEGVLSNIYIQRAKKVDHAVWSEQLGGNWASMFGLLNIVMRPLGGYIADKLFLYTGDARSKKYWNTALNTFHGAMFLAAGLSPQLSVHHLIALTSFVSIGLCAANGANFSIVPHVFPKRNGVISGATGSWGNLGGVFGALIFRFNGTDYPKALWTIGALILAVQCVVIWIPMPRK